MFKKTAAFILAALTAASVFASAVSARSASTFGAPSAASSSVAIKVDAARDDYVTLMVTLDEPPLCERRNGAPLDEYLASAKGIWAKKALADKIAAAKAAVAEACPEAVFGQAEHTLLTVGFAVTVPYDKTGAVAEACGGASVAVCSSYAAPEDKTGYGKYMANAAALVGIADYGRGGEGTVISVLDSGLDTDHEEFADESVTSPALTLDGIEAVFKKTNAYLYYGADDAADLYRGAKIPFAFDYADRDGDVTTTDTHGTHVAACAVGSDAGGGRFNGAAPNAQLIFMKVFGDNGTCSDEDLVSAIEDSLLLGADVINMSLGVTTSTECDYDSFDLYTTVNRAYECGVLLVAAAGNEQRVWQDTISDSEYGVSLPRASYPDYGLISSPSTNATALSVGSVDNAVSYYYTISTTDGEHIPAGRAYLDNETLAQPTFFDLFAKKRVELVPVPGYGEEKDYEGIDVKSKIAFVSRGSTFFSEKIIAAANAGAAGIIIYDNKENESFTILTSDAPIPAISITKADAAKITATADKDGRIYIEVGENKLAAIKSASYGAPSAFSSWGTTSELQIKPELCAVGGSILSAVPDGYDAQSGTSMASPVTAGLAASLKSHLIEKGRADALAENAPYLLKLYLMTTAIPALDKNGVEYSPRRQGAGVASLESAENAVALVYAADGRREAKAELGAVERGENGDAVVSFDIVIENITDADRLYSLTCSAASDNYVEYSGIYYAAETAHAFAEAQISAAVAAGGDGTSVTNGDNINVNALSGSPASVFVKSGEAVTLTLTVRLPASAADEWAAIFENGFFLEGFVRAESEGFASGMPYMCFVGDWDSLPILDDTVYGGDPLYPDSGAVYVVVERDEAVIASGRRWDKDDGIYYADMLAFSPNRDGFADYMMLYFTLLRNADTVYTTVTDPRTGEVILCDSYDNMLVPKSRHIEGFDPGEYIVLWNGTDGENTRYIFPDGEYVCTLTVGWNGRTETREYTVALDTKAPTLDKWEIVERGGRRYLRLKASDENALVTASVFVTQPGFGDKVAEENVAADIETDMVYYQDHSYSYSTGKRSATVLFDITDWDADYVYVEITDCALNTYCARLPVAG